MTTNYQKTSVDLTKRLHQADNEDYIDPRAFSASEVVEIFFSQINHPSTPRDRTQFAERVGKLLGGQTDDDLNASQIAWRGRFQETMVETFAVDDKLLDEWLATDRPLAQLFQALKDTKPHFTEVKELRDAIELLVDLRSGVLHRGEENPIDDEQWFALIERLMRGVI